MAGGGSRVSGPGLALASVLVACSALIVGLCAAPVVSAAAADAPAAGAAKPKKGKKGPKRDPKELRKLTRAGCTPYRAILQGKYSSKRRRAAKRWKFKVFHFNTRLKPPVNWADKDPYHSRSFRQNLHGFTWMDTLLHGYKRTGDGTTLRRARDLALDWIKSNPLR